MTTKQLTSTVGTLTIETDVVYFANVINNAVCVPAMQYIYIYIYIYKDWSNVRGDQLLRCNAVFAFGVFTGTNPAETALTRINGGPTNTQCMISTDGTIATQTHEQRLDAYLAVQPTHGKQ